MLIAPETTPEYPGSSDLDTDMSDNSEDKHAVAIREFTNHISALLL